ncbi:hypothetical protein ACL6C3_01155 [Capilliphycus salinus ALCB114379]|uniref:hypothetical protein n=1 Tax=Capilliphycus salinus TaxID=2768948 RepID=UPI0039A6726A
MAQTEPLKGTELIDCAKACANLGLKQAAENCGYGEDLDGFKTNLQQAGDRMGIHINDLSDLVTPQQQVKQGRGIEIAPDSKDSL